MHDVYSVALPPGSDRDVDIVFERAVQALVAYRIFPQKRMRFRICSKDVVVRAGTLIIQRVFLGILAVEMAVRVTEIFDRHGSAGREFGFGYVTLAGHMESGVAHFFVRRSPLGEITFNIESWSRPGNLFAKVVRPIARSVQKRFTTEALSNFVRQIGE